MEKTNCKTFLSPMKNDLPYNDFNSFLKKIFGVRCHKITIDAGLTCPNRDGTKGYGGCIYCNARGSGTGAYSKGISIKDQIKSAKAYLSKRYKAKKFLAYFQSFSNTYAPLDKLKKFYQEALEVPDIVGLAIGTRPDCISDEVLDYLEELNKDYMIWLEVGLQSAHDKTLKLINRGHTVQDFVDAVERIRKRKINVCTHIIIGLPQETREDIMYTAKFLAKLDIQAIKIHLLYVIKNTKLHELYKKGEYKCLSREEYVSLVSEFLTYLPKSVIVQRITGDPHPEELVAPMWALEKQKNRELIIKYMKEKNLYQGKNYCKETSV